MKILKRYGLMVAVLGLAFCGSVQNSAAQTGSGQACAGSDSQGCAIPGKLNDCNSHHSQSSCISDYLSSGCTGFPIRKCVTITTPGTCNVKPVTCGFDMITPCEWHPNSGVCSGAGPGTPLRCPDDSSC